MLRARLSAAQRSPPARASLTGQDAASPLIAKMEGKKDRSGNAPHQQERMLKALV